MLSFKELLKKVEDFEGFSTYPYRCPSNVLTIGFGQTSSCFPSGKMPDSITRQDAEKLLEKNLTNTMTYVESRLSLWGYSEEEVQICLLPITDFTYNCGYSNFANLFKNGKRNIEEVIEKIVEYNKSNGTVLKGLVNRRKWEQDILKKHLAEYRTIEKENPTAKDLQMLVNNIYGEDVLKVDGIIGKNSIKFTYNLLLKLV